MADAPKKTERELLDALDALYVGGVYRWRHYKNGHDYILERYAINEATQEPMAVYHRVGSSLSFARPAREWDELVPDADGNMVPRFREAK
jgi:hypothetical protein